jgi:hypothetical protein
MPYYNVAYLLVIVTTRNIMRTMAGRDGILRRTPVWQPYYVPSFLQSSEVVTSAGVNVSSSPWQKISTAPKVSQRLPRGPSCSSIWLFNKSHILASWVQLYNGRYFPVHLRILLQQQKVLCSAKGGPGSDRNCIVPRVRTMWGSGRFVCSF